MRSRLTAGRVAVLATNQGGGPPHLVPCCFALEEDTLYTAVDSAKPKSTLALRRVSNIQADSKVSLLVQNYDDDWSSLWWVRADGRARIVDGDERGHAIFLLSAKYEQYRREPPPGPVIAVDIVIWRAWP